MLQLLVFTPLAISTFAATGGSVEPNWPGPSYISAVPLVALLVTRLKPRAKKIFSASAIVLGVVTACAIYAHAFHPFLPVPVTIDPVLQQTYGWKETAEGVLKEVQKIPDANKRVPVTFSYRLASELFYYSGDTMSTLCLDRRFLDGKGFNLDLASKWIAIEQYPAVNAVSTMNAVCPGRFQRVGVASAYDEKVVRRVDLLWCEDK